MNLYLLFKSLHLVAVISWMAGLLYLPRIFVYHSEADHESQKNVFKIMERKLYNYIMMPAMLLSWLFGVLLIHSLGFGIFFELWMQIKIFAVFIFLSLLFWKNTNLTRLLPLLFLALVARDQIGHHFSHHHLIHLRHHLMLSLKF